MCGSLSCTCSLSVSVLILRVGVLDGRNARFLAERAMVHGHRAVWHAEVHMRRHVDAQTSLDHAWQQLDFVVQGRPCPARMQTIQMLVVSFPIQHKIAVVSY